MSKVITFSRTFPAYHPRKCEQTNFVEKIHWWFWDNAKHGYASAYDMILDLNKDVPKQIIKDFIDSLDCDGFYKGIEKNQTIRAGNRWKVGDWFSPRVWSGQPYNSKQIIIAPDIEIKKVWNIEIDLVDQYEGVYIVTESGEIAINEEELSKNDGLTVNDFYDWFDTPKNRKQVFKGQIICWNENIEY